MAHEELIYGLMESMVIADKHIIGDLMAHKGLWTKGVSAVNNSYKALNLLVDGGKLIKGDGYFKLPDCKSEYKEHAQLLTKALAEIIKLNLNAKIYREVNLKEIALRPDAIVFLAKGDHKLCFCLEVCNNETEEYLTSKVNALKNWNGALQTFSLLFETNIKGIDFVVSGEISADETFEFNSYLKEVGQ
jgi:hypothetical protein